MDFSSISTPQSRILNSQRLIWDILHATFMNSWNPTVAHGIFDRQQVGFLSYVEPDQVNVNSRRVAFTIRELVKKDGINAYSAETQAKGIEYIQNNPSTVHKLPFPRPTFGYILKWVSEVGDKATLDSLLNHVDQFFHPTWRDGGLYYPANTQQSDPAGNWTEVDPFTGNSTISVATAPHIVRVDLASGVDFLRGCWDVASKAMVVTMRSWDGTSKRVDLQFCNLPVGVYGVYHNGNLDRICDVTRPKNGIKVSVDVDGEEFNLVLLQQ